MQLLTSKKNKQELASFIANPSQALLLVGQMGSGKGHIAEYLSSKLLNEDTSKTYQNTRTIHIAPSANTISIDDIRRLQSFMSLKTIGRQAIRRIAVIEDADSLTIEAQNAFLKLLEEPPADTVIILTAATHRALLPTVLSRTQKITIGQLSKAEITNHFKSLGYKSQEIERAYSLSEGKIGLMSSILENSDQHQLVQAISKAKSVLSASTYQRIGMIDELSKDKENLALLLDAMARIGRAVFRSSAQKKTEELKAWQNRLIKVLEARELLAKNAQAKLLLTDLFLNF